MTPEERAALEAAHAELRTAVEAYERFLEKELRPGEDVAAMRADELRAAQERVEAAETKLWARREQLLGWRRPAWAPPATLVSDWILEEDPGYDDEPDAAWR
ncbi:MAG: hypothetical protein JWO37_1003 [Acidimicrobiales bacterium]|nr:hypothetical protein [Acidimicrobiales bacterium]